MTNRINAYSRRSFLAAALTLLSAARAVLKMPPPGVQEKLFAN
jgi:hypothetical protein